jgi:lipopolysaccharide biosynthesis glycosyltransferase
MLVLSPGEVKFTQLNELLRSKGSWDGGDQGLLNEWRGGDWNRLSFVYNTTPTAAYTYAPAYKCYGSQISAIHFIGPNKPWNSITSRSPFTSTSWQKSNDPSDPQRTYDYDSLVDMWYAVYDKHYRSQVVVPEADFELRHYPAAWDEGGSGKA